MNQSLKKRLLQDPKVNDGDTIHKVFAKNLVWYS